ncbi:MAG: hypothetical protein OEN50_20105 [Deltaproteobacteria bacterium]|nr:hypothetical protein [Deltaproteobacteria bacterium]
MKNNQTWFHIGQRFRGLPERRLEILEGFTEFSCHTQTRDVDSDTRRHIMIELRLGQAVA